MLVFRVRRVGTRILTVVDNLPLHSVCASFLARQHYVVLILHIGVLDHQQGIAAEVLLDLGAATERLARATSRRDESRKART